MDTADLRDEPAGARGPRDHHRTDQLQRALARRKRVLNYAVERPRPALAASSRKAHRTHLEKHGLALGEFDLIASLGNTDGKRMKELADGMITSPSNVTRLCVALEKRGLVERQRSERSDREVVARLTAEGQALFEAVFLDVAEFTKRLIRGGLRAREMTAAAEVLDKFAASAGV